MTKAQIIELVQLRLEGGDYANSQYTDQEIAQYIELAYNKLYKIEAAGAMAEGDRIPESSMLARFEVTASKYTSADINSDFDTDYYRMELPLTPVNLADGMGLWRIHHAQRIYGGALREFIPIPKGGLFLAGGSIMNANFLESIDHYEWSGGKVVHLKEKSAFSAEQNAPFIVHMVVNNFASLSDSDVASFPADMVADIVTTTMQILTGAKEDDSSANFNQVR
jgi:hypothetical protein